ncbi:hypothetical protein HON52_03030 [Candidatus Uhrbacteria bacterium]|jgi:hypothetical protein|nr:hypothetical protein [Candidatus Uhrbacteria bacterium]
MSIFDRFRPRSKEEVLKQRVTDTALEQARQARDGANEEASNAEAAPEVPYTEVGGRGQSKEDVLRQRATDVALEQNQAAAEEAAAKRAA